jgi:hypothetical protein
MTSSSVDLGLTANDAKLTVAGYVIEQKGKHITAESEIAFDELDMKEAEAGGFEDQFDSSLSMGLALLRDINRKIALPITVETSDEDSSVQLAPTVFKAFRNALACG